MNKQKSSTNNKQSNNNNNQKQQPKQQSQSLSISSQNNNIPLALQIFSKTRDIDSNSPYHLDGNMQMYTQQKQKIRKQLSQDYDIKKQIEQIVKLYQLKDGKILEEQYKKIQKYIALILRPDIQEQQLEFIVDQDWRLDQKDGYILPENMSQKIFQLVDIWTIGVQKMEYITFIKLLAKKLRNKKK